VFDVLHYLVITQSTVMKRSLGLCLLLVSLNIAAQSSDEKAIRGILNRQTADWNAGNIQGFMKGYLKNDSLMFIGQSGVKYGWTNTLNSYKKNYPDTASMGKLTFTLINVKKLSGQFYHVVGKWHLKRSIGDLNGHFTLLFEKIKGEWVIICDHSS